MDDSNSIEKKLFLPAFPVSEAQAFADSLHEYLLEKDPSVKIQLNQEPFRNYLIQRLYIDSPDNTRYELENIPSITMAKDILGHKMLIENKEGGYDPISNSIVLVKHCEDGTMSKIYPGTKLEQVGVCSDDALTIANVLDEIFMAEPSNDIPPSFPPVIDLPGLSTSEGSDGFQRDETSRIKMIKIPEGVLPIYRNAEGFRKIFLTTIKQHVFISEKLVTVGEYADFLTHNPEMRKPDQSNAGWSDNGNQIICLPSAKDLPVTGISRKEAEKYLEWFGGKYRAAVDNNLKWWLRLPDPDWLQIAALGSELRELMSDGTGPYGHQNITGKCWQWTSGNEGDAALAFGGSFIEENEAGETQKMLEQHYPDLSRRIPEGSRNPNVGFRICIVDLSDD